MVIVAMIGRRDDCTNYNHPPIMASITVDYSVYKKELLGQPRDGCVYKKTGRDSDTSLYGILTCIELGLIAAAHGSNTTPRLLRAGPFGKRWCTRWPLPPQISLH
eukprot:gene18546-biopygen8407